MTPAVRARGWCRVDFAGGTLDIWPLGLLHRGARTVNTAIDLPVQVAILPRERGFRVVQDDGDWEAEGVAELIQSPRTALVGLILEALEIGPAEIRLSSSSPRGGGLGASSALAVTLISAARRLRGDADADPGGTVALARDLEARLMSLPTGCQDHYPALLGGALVLEPIPGGQRVRQLPVDLEALGQQLVLAFTGQSHFSAGANWTIVRRRLDGDPEISRLFAAIAEVASEMEQALVAGSWSRVGALMAEEWRSRRRFSEAISTPGIERLLEAASLAGAWGGKACGAGGGGCVAVLTAPELRAGVEQALREAGGQIVAARPTALPLSVTAR
ncbi:MAG TPA: hypothetical protein VF017_07485 [Thermoanaerobaculia bacterium]|nr:hypothetical protein [Thermoanaerobaculia bacterium]